MTYSYSGDPIYPVDIVELHEVPRLSAPAVEKRHIFYTDGWGAGGTSLGARSLDVKPLHGARKSRDSDMPKAPGGQAASKLNFNKVRQLFVSKSWAPG